MPSRLRQDENPPYPEYAVAILKSALDIHQDIGGMKHAVEALEATAQRHGEKLEAIVEMVHVVKSLKETSEKQSGRIENIEGQVNHARGTLTAFKWIGAIVGITLTALEIYKYLPK